MKTSTVHSPRRRTATGTRIGTLTGALLRVAAASLVVFHGFLLWDRVASLTLLDPAVALRWGAAAALALGLARLKRAGAPLLSGRGALVVWSLVALLHASMVPGLGGLAATLAEADAGLWLAIGLSGLLILSGARAAVTSAPPRHGANRMSWLLTTPSLRAARLAPLSPRPPPRA